MLAASTTTAAQAPQRFVMNREIPRASKMSDEQLSNAARQSNRVPKNMGINN